MRGVFKTFTNLDRLMAVALLYLRRQQTIDRISSSQTSIASHSARAIAEITTSSTIVSCSSMSHRSVQTLSTLAAVQAALRDYWRGARIASSRWIYRPR
jgi:hypothetical protein